MSKASNIMFAATDSYKEIEDKSNAMWKREMEFKNLAKNTIKASSKYLTCNSELSTVEGTVAESFASLLGEISEEVDVSHIGSIMKSIGKLRAKMVNQVANDFFNPLKEFIEFKFGYAQYLKSQVKKSVREYQTHLDQFEKGNIIKDGKVAGGKFAQLEKELQQVKETINSNATQFGNVINDLEKKKSLIVLRQIIKCMEVHQSFYNNVIVLFDELMPKLEQLSKNLEETEPTKIQKEGYLLAKRGKNNWNKEFFELRDEKLYNYKIEKGLRYSGLAPDKTMELNLCSIKTNCPEKLKDRLKDDAKRCFQIFTPQKKPLVLIAPTKSETKSWVDSLLSAISLSLDNSNTGSTGGNTEPPKNTKVIKLLRSVPGNHNCVDCDAEDPVWASINLGVLICVECSGVHRYLGVHITKVRSLTLDHWDPEQLIYMMKVGNEKANHFFECRIPEGYDKPTATSSRADRERYITAKYKEKLFVPPLTANFNINSVLYEMVSSEGDGDVMKMIMLLFYGGDVNYKENGKSLLSQSVSKDNWLYAQTLFLFGVDLFQSDEIGWTPFHHAANANSYHSLLVLLRNGKEKDISTLKDNLHQNPLDIANHNNFKESQVLLSGNLSWTMSIDELVEVVENETNDLSILFPILVNCPSTDPPSPSNQNILNDPSSPRVSLRESSSESVNNGDNNNGNNNDDSSSHIVKTAWKRGGDEKSKETEKKSNRISVLMSSITKEGSRKNSSETLKDGKESSSLSTSTGRDSLKEKGDSKIINLIARKGKRSTIGAFTRSSPNGKSEPSININNNNNGSNGSNSLSNIPSPRFRKVPPSIEILESFPNFEKSYLDNLSASLHGDNNNNNNNNIIIKEEEEIDDSDTTDDEYDEEYMEFNPPDFEPPPPPDSQRKNDYTAEDIENALD